MTFSTLLVANRGEIARRVIKGARDVGIRCVAVYVDADAGSPYVRDADEARRLETGYLDGEAILDAARASGAQAIHPGYGYLSENAQFARSVIDAGLVWVGPSPEAMAALGDKLAAKQLAADVGVATLPSSDDPLDASQVGFPLMVKAAAGGGGKGMRLVHSGDELDDAVRAAQREAAGGFGDDRVFLERYVARARHIEVQVLGDHFGNLVHLGERECSVQRRHQKVLEESPSPIVDDALRAQMGSAAIELARRVSYSSAGTIEFLVDDDTRAFYFLEANTRLQVEHPVTELVTGVDLVHEQLRVAAGERLRFNQDDVRVTGSAIEVRLCAEDAAAGFLPATGTIEAFALADHPVVRLESGVEVGSVVTVQFDPLLAKVIAHAPTRSEAAATLALALERCHLGGVATNRDFLVSTLRSEQFIAGDTTTDFIDRVQPARLLVLGEQEDWWTQCAAALWLQGRNRHEAHVLASVPSGWRNARMPRQSVALRTNGRGVVVSYRSRRDGTFDVGDTSHARVHHWSPTSIDLEVDGRRSTSVITSVDDRLHVQCTHGTVTFSVEPRFEVPGVEVVHGGLVAPMPGVIIEVRVESGQDVTAGQTLVVMEAMKMEHVISAPRDGTVTEVFVSTGEQVDNGATLLALDTDEDAA